MASRVVFFSLRPQNPTRSLQSGPRRSLPAKLLGPTAASHTQDAPRGIRPPSTVQSPLQATSAPPLSLEVPPQTVNPDSSFRDFSLTELTVSEDFIYLLNTKGSQTGISHQASSLLQPLLSGDLTSH